MNIIRWILSNIILILFVLALTYAYVYWDNLTGEDTPAGQVVAWLSDEFDAVRDFVEDMQDDQTATPVQAETDTAPAEISTETVTEDDAEAGKAGRSAAERFASAESSSALQPAPATKQTQAPSTRPAGKPGSGIEQESAASGSAGKTQQREAASAQPAAQAQARSEPQAQPRPQPAPQPRSSAATEPSAQSSQGSAAGGQAGGAAARKPAAPAGNESASAESQPSVREQWIEARNEYLDGDYQASISKYQEVIERSEDNYDAWGELGNVYYRQRNYEQAAEAYFNAAEILVRLGQAYRARSLQSILSRLDREKSLQLQELLQTSR